MIKRIGSMLLLLILLTACSNKSSYTEMGYPGKFSIDAPSTMQKTKHLNSAASFQLQNANEELYFIVLNENKAAIKAMFEQAETNVEGDEKAFDLFAQGTLDLLTSTLTNIEPNKLVFTANTINGLKGKRVDFTATVSGLDVYYTFAAFEGKDDYYQVLTWTLKKRKEENKEKMERMITSFKEVNE